MFISESNFPILKKIIETKAVYIHGRYFIIAPGIVYDIGYLKFFFGYIYKNNRDKKWWIKTWLKIWYTYM